MRLFTRSSCLHAAAIVLAVTAAAHADPPAAKRQTPQERKRQQILDELGLEKTDPPAPPSVPPPPEPAAAAPERLTPGPSLEPAARTAPAPSFRRAIHPLLLQSCQVCHRAGGPGGATRLVLVGDAAADFASVRSLVAPSAPLTSTLLSKASGQSHGGGAPWPASGEAHERVLAWIAKGARFDGVAATPVVAPVAVESAGRRPVAPRAIAPRQTAPAPEAAAPIATPSGDASADLHALLTSACATCHNARGAAAATKLVLTGDPSADVTSARALIDPAAPASSLLVRKATGELHGGGVVLPPNDPRLAMLVAWIGSVAPKPVAPVEPTPSTRPAPEAEVAAAPAVLPAAPHAPNGLPLVGGFLLNGRFDLAYERHQFSGDPFADASTAALRSYHHFLFLSRESADDPFGLSVELTSLLFWEAHARLGGHGRPWHLLVSGGKILVPFGADPLTHQSYGGLEGFDQRLLPVIWAQEGVAAHLTFDRGPLVLTDDAFVVRGYALSRADAVLNLQADFSATDDARVGWGNRVGLAWMNASAWYSVYFNPLGFGRRLFLQAADLTIWRPRSVPVLGHFSAGAGVLRADVSGGGAGLDYYHFGSYVQLRYHPTDWLYVQYRQGLRTFDNRRGIFLDETRLTPDDMSTHNFAVVARCRGLSFTLAYFLILEKAGELPNDFARASVAYDF
jgi:mono/diheme cytochrome c family protein